MNGEPAQTFASVWDALEDTPEDAAHMRLRSDLVTAIREAVERWHITQSAAAERLGVSRPRMNDLLRGRVGRFSLDTLVGLAGRAGMVVRMVVEQRAA